jgi:archaellum component FlaG (FlaF/FlaG flagellin family)
MDKYLLAIVALIIFSILVILYSKKTTQKVEENISDDSDNLADLKEDDFTLLE